jgi:hypothetical protein
VAKDGDGEGGDQIVNHVESGNEDDTREDVSGGRDKGAGAERSLEKKMIPPNGSLTPVTSLIIASTMSRTRKLTRNELRVARRNALRSCGRASGGV